MRVNSIMQANLKIQQGKWKGKRIHLADEIQKNSHFTTAIVKKSFTNTLLALQNKGLLDFSETCFIDLFAGSGQMGLEAISLGFKKVVFFELDKNRFFNILQTFQKLTKENNNELGYPKFFLKDVFRFYKKWDGWEIEKDLVFYMDPPFSFWDECRVRIEKLILEIQNAAIDKNSIFLFVQTPSNINLKNMKKYRLGSNSLYFWSNKT